VCYEEGRGVPVNVAEAIHWYLRACGFVMFSLLFALFTHPFDISKILPSCRYRRGAAAGFTESQQVLNEICSDDIDGGVCSDEENSNQGTCAPEISTANSSLFPSLPAAAAAAADEKELWAKVRAMGVHSSIHLCVAIARNFSRHKHSLPQGSAGTSIAEGCLARVKVEC
jgi:hypothetical protein